MTQEGLANLEILNNKYRNVHTKEEYGVINYNCNANTKEVISIYAKDSLGKEVLISGEDLNLLEIIEDKEEVSEDCTELPLVYDYYYAEGE